jgi:hypothetical protein
MGGAVGRQESPPQPTVNNFAAVPHQDGFRIAWLVSAEPFSRPGGPGLLTTSRLDDYELIDRPAGRGLTL